METRYAYECQRCGAWDPFARHGSPCYRCRAQALVLVEDVLIAEVPPPPVEVEAIDYDDDPDAREDEPEEPDSWDGRCHGCEWC